MGRPAVKTQLKEKRVKNFNEVSLGYPKKLALEEARRCPQCADPVCVSACPLGINIPGFIRLLREGQIDKAYTLIQQQNSLASICGRMCSAPCEKKCTIAGEGAPIAVRALERFASDFGRQKVSKLSSLIRTGKRIAIVGSGPSGFTAAVELVRKKYEVTIFESFEKPGGILRYGVPEFRIPKKILDQEFSDLQNLGVKVETSVLIGCTETVEDLFKQGFDAVLLATGAGIPKFMDHLPGTHLGCVYYGEEFLMRVNRLKRISFLRSELGFPVGRRIMVIGSGNTALDCARIGVRLDREVKLVFRRTEDDMYVARQEREYAKEEGVVFEPLVKPVEILADPNGFVIGVKCLRMDYADVNADGKWQLMPVPNSEFILETDTVVIAVGHHPNSLVAKNVSKVRLDREGTIKVNEENSMTSMPGVFVAGNVRLNAGPLIRAIVSGKQAAEDIDNYLK